MKAEGARIVKAYPLRYLKLSAMRTVDLIHKEFRSWTVRSRTIYLFALGGLFYALRSREPIYFLLLAHIAHFVAFHSAINVQCTGSSARSCRMILLAGLPVYAWWQKREARLHAEFASPAPGRVRGPRRPFPRRTGQPSGRISTAPTSVG